MEYCSFYKKILIEELIFHENFSKLHCGKCSVIGEVISENDNFYLTNTKLRFLTEEYQLPRGVLRLYLDLTVWPEIPKVNQFYEVIGEVVIYYKQNIIAIDKAKEHLEKLLIEFNSETDENKQAILNNRFQVGIQVHSLNVINQPIALIENNLEIRNLHTILTNYNNKIK